MGTPSKAPKLKALPRIRKYRSPLTTTTSPKVLLVRGTARLQTVDGVVPEYAAAAERYFGREQGQAWVKQLGGMVPQWCESRLSQMGRVLDFQHRFPSALPL